MRFQSLVLLAGATIAAADSTVTLFLPGFDKQSLDAKILGSSQSMTTYSLNCPSGEDSEDCGVPADFTIMENASSMNYVYSYSGETVSEACKLQGTTRATCWATIITDGSTSIMTSTAVDVASIPYGGFLPVHVTATEDGGAAASTGASVSATTASATTGTSTGTSTGSATVVTGTGSESSAATAAASQTESTNAAMPKITGNARWVAGGAAAALALVVV